MINFAVKDTSEAIQSAKDLISKGMLSSVGALQSFAAAAGLQERPEATVSQNTYWNKLEIHCPLVTRTPTEVTEVLIDKSNETALVTYVTTLQPVEPYYSVFCIKNQPISNVPTSGAKETRQATLKRYDKGWRVLSD